MKLFLACVLVALLANSVFALVCPEPDMLGVYFDLDANYFCTSVQPNVPIDAYVIATNVSADEVHGVEFGYTVLTNVGWDGLVLRLAETLPVGAQNTGDSSSPLVGDYNVDFASPVPGAGASIVLVTWQYLLLGPMAVEFHLGPADSESLPDGLPAMDVGGSMAPLYPLTGPVEWQRPVATLNGDCPVNFRCWIHPVATEKLSWSTVKALYR